jgi:hypothetical protein
MAVLAGWPDTGSNIEGAWPRCGQEAIETWRVLLRLAAQLTAT